jgi:molybdopterin molybdotransferase
MHSLIQPNEASALIRANLRPAETVFCSIETCAGRILRQEILADRPFPPFNRSMMDGYALRATEIGDDGIFTIKVQVPAGSAKTLLGTESGHCAEIMTGACVPDDTDCVVPYEATERIDESTIRLLKPDTHKPGDCIHPYASDRESGEVLLEPGVLLGGREIAVAASCGYAQVEVAKIPRIAILSTGDELIDVSSQPAPHQIRRSNDISIETSLAKLHLYPQTRTHLPDDQTASIEGLEKLMKANDILILSGGISMGKKDYIPSALDLLGLKCHFHGVAQKPGKPMGFWSQRDCAVFALPGNPSSTLTCLHQYVLPAIFHAMGQTAPPIPQQVTLNAPVKARDDLTIFLPVKCAIGNWASPQPTNNSGDLVRILQSEGYIALPPTEKKGYPQGASFDFHPWY